MKADELPDEHHFEIALFEIGYKEVYNALQESKAHLKRDIALPTQLPPIPFTHHFGRFNNLDGDINDGFEIKYINKDSVQNHYSIRVKPVEYRLEFREDYIKQSFKLNNGPEAIFSTKPLGMNFLFIRK